MPDVTMCYGNWCPLKDLCYRFTATPDTMQSYFSEVPYEKYEEGKCLYFWDKDTRRAEP